MGTCLVLNRKPKSFHGPRLTVITISKYDRYQRVSLPNDATIASLPNAIPTQERHKVEGTEQKEDFKAAARGDAGVNARTAIGLNITNAWTPSARITISDEAFDLARQVVDAIGAGAVGHPIEVGAPAHCQKWINEGWNPHFCVIVVRQVMSRRGHDNPPNTLKFFDKAISQYHAEMQRPLPKTTIKTQETFDVAGSKITASGKKSAGGSRGNSVVAGLRLAHEVLGIDIENDDRF